MTLVSFCLVHTFCMWHPSGTPMAVSWVPTVCWGVWGSCACHVGSAHCNYHPVLAFHAALKMRSGKAPRALESSREDTQTHGEATQATTPLQPPSEAPAINGPGPEDTKDAAREVLESGHTEPGRGRPGKKPSQKKRKRSPRGGPCSADLALVGLSADHVWLDKPLFDQAESCYLQRLADAAAQVARPQILAPLGPCSHGVLVACHHVAWGIWVNKPVFDQAERAFMEWSQSLLLLSTATERSSQQGSLDIPQRVVAPDQDVPVPCLPSPPANGQPPLGSLQALVREVWLDKPRYDAAERGFYEALFDGHPPGKVRLQERASQADSGARRGRRDRRARNGPGSKRAGPRRPEGETSPALPHWYLLHKDAEGPWLSKSAYDSAECRHHAAEALRMAWRLEAMALAHRPAPRVGPTTSSLRPK